MPQKGKNIYQRKDGRWEGRYIKGRTEAGKAVYGYVYAHTYEEVTKKRDEAADGVDPEKLKKNVPKKDSAEAVAIEWLYSLKPQIKKSTFCKYHTSIYCYIIPELGQKDINDISVMDLQNFCNNLFHYQDPVKTAILKNSIRYHVGHEKDPSLRLYPRISASL